jgi:hypothetical protein
MKTAIAKLRDGTEVEVRYAYGADFYPLWQVNGVLITMWTLEGKLIRDSDGRPGDIVNIDDVLHDLGIPNTSYVVKTLANTKWSELPESTLRAMYDLLTGE